MLFYIMGLSYGVVSLVLTALGHPLGKTMVYAAVQAAGAKVVGLRREEVQLSTVRTLVAALGADLTSVKCKGEWLMVGLTTDAVAGTTLTIDILDNGEAATLQAWVEEVAEAVQASVPVTDDADGFKKAADGNGLQHQMCKKHVLNNSEAWHDAMALELARDADGSLVEIGVTPQQVSADNDALLRMMRERQSTPEANAKLAEIHLRYAQARSPKKLAQDRESLAYRMHLFSLDRWNLWPRLTLYRTWRGPHDIQLDGTNNATERTIGWRIKERYRSMRGYKRKQLAFNVSRLIAWAGNLLGAGGADLAAVIA